MSRVGGQGDRDTREGEQGIMVEERGDRVGKVADKIRVFIPTILVD